MTLAERIIAVLQEQAPDGEAVSFADLRQALAPFAPSALSVALRTLRYAGKIEWNRIALAPSLRMAGKKMPVAAPGIAEAVKMEALASSQASARARTSGSVQAGKRISADAARKASTIGAELQRVAVENAQDAASILNRRWGTVWTQLCAHARAADQRPVPHMVALLEQAMGVEN